MGYPGFGYQDKEAEIIISDSDINKTIISNQDLNEFYANIPYKFYINDENYELDSDFLNFIYNLILNNDFDSFMNKNFISSTELASILNNLNKRLKNNGKVPILSNNLPIKEVDEDTYTDTDSDSDTDSDVDSDDDSKIIDIQGLIWDNIEQRENLLKIRELKHKSFTNITDSKQDAQKDINTILKNINYGWKFGVYFKIPKPKLSHFQLRNNLICLNSIKEVFYNELSNEKPPNHDYYDLSLPTLHSVIKKINTYTGDIETVLSLDDDPIERISTIECTDNGLLIAGTLTGSYHVKNLKTGDTTKKILTTNSNGIINFAKSVEDSILFSTNDMRLITTDLQNFKVRSMVDFPWAINSVSFNPLDPNIKLIVGDNINSFILDDRVSANKPVNIIKGHKDFSFACDWSHNGTSIATGNQDSTVRVYDIRNLKENQYCMKGEIESSVRNVKFNNNDSMLAFSEGIDYVNLVDLNSIDSGQGSKQVISMFGKIVGLDFSNYDDGTGEMLTVGINDESIGGILQYLLESEETYVDYDWF
ncbi:Vegetative incompatibility protein [Wickerhamomyces ciferrii]|uniref:Vegetative incompatibility protein n=1 Tax=Wickerhamomyces ciferrii (strain ATCC 14091 / BCRC 22168 / CBS 111 / JCM 3599 / NBRC 0793 / NRRL Y-1031 F-60-10) TaxID=1206466 RepID=K0KAX8_WICCF|nr:Vegetative incompatibility protein [Wickerhamomyces ciferrii]CCH42155.1 Vegetative incompatibility protein [Wickerhamomyces ciferrii]